MRWTAVETFLDTADAWVDGRAEGADVVWAAGDAGLLLTAVPARRELDDLLVQAVGRPLVVASTDDDAGKAVLFAVGDLTRAVRLDDVDPDVTVLTCGTLHPVAGAQVHLACSDTHRPPGRATISLVMPRLEDTRQAVLTTALHHVVTTGRR